MSVCQTIDQIYIKSQNTKKDIQKEKNENKTTKWTEKEPHEQAVFV